ncbi:MAG: hypothetical protein JXA20_08140 [Spirochaetes bacterium]|nr:hypothetical protein [Spirochaetota bacterium]
MKREITFLRTCYWFGAIVDAIAVLPLLFPEVAGAMFGINPASVGNDFLYIGRVGASLMAGWTALLLWADRKPVERRGVILLTLVPVLVGLIAASIAAAAAAAFPVERLVPLWVFYGIAGPLYVFGYRIARRIAAQGESMNTEFGRMSPAVTRIP